MELINITYIPQSNTIQAVASFNYKEKTEHTVVMIDLEKEKITTDFTKVKDDKVFLSKCQEAMVLKIESIDNPIVK